MPQHATKTSWKKGKSPNPAGRPPMSPEKYDFKLALERMMPLASQRLREMLESDDFEKHKFAIPIVYDRYLGKAIERKELTGAGGGAIQIEDNTPSIRLLLQQALPAEEPTKTIDGEVTDT